MATHDALARRLRDAYVHGAVEPLRDGLAPDDAAGAYAVQAINTRIWKDAGRRIVGRKIGLTAVAVQKQLGVDQPDYGVLFDDMLIAGGGRLEASSVIQPKAEAEIAFVLGADLCDPGLSSEQIARAVEYVVPAIEIVDSRIADWKITFADTVADNGSSAFFVLGESRRRIADVDLYSCGMVMEANGAIVSTGVGAACLGHPLYAAAWLARTLALAGDPLREGDVLLTGALGPMISLNIGDVIEAKIGGLGHCSFSYEKGDR